MNAVAAKTPAPTKHSAAQPVTKLSHDVHAKLKAVRDAIRAADQKLEAAYDAVEAGESLELVLDLIAHELMADAVSPMLRSGIPSQADSETAYEAMFKPLAALEAAIAMAGEHVIGPFLREAWQLFDWANDQMGSNCALWNLLPETADAHHAPSESVQQDDEEDARRSLAFDTNFEVGELAEAMVRLLDIERGEDFHVYHGMLARIQLCSHLTFHLMRLDGCDNDEESGRPALEELERAYKGVM